MKITIDQAMAAHQDGKFEEAEQHYKSILKAEPHHLDANNNLGVLLLKLRRFKEAEQCCKKAIERKPEFSETYVNLGVILEELKKFDEAETCYKKAIWYKPDLAEAHKNLNNLLENIKLLNILNKNKSNNSTHLKRLNSASRLNSNPFISFNEVDESLIEIFYKVNLKKLNQTINLKKELHRFDKGPLNGNGKTTDFNFFGNNFEITKNVKKNLTNIMESAVNSEIYIKESFLNIFKNGTGSVPHSHISNFDKNNGLVDKKFSLVYYLSIGDQDCKEPGIFKINNPSEEILPKNGMIIIIPADRKHSAVYDGKKDRIMIGVNFYSLL
tara:strand:- start:616 stop:1596 length:981 start_codon:yes stop_codon:yes gene_type:complete